MTKSALKPPFLKKISLLAERVDKNVFPFNSVPFLREDGFELEFPAPVTFFVGENGTGKSTVLEAIAELASFHVGGGSSDHKLHETSDGASSNLVDALRASWLPKISKGFFFRADTFAEVARYIDDVGAPTMDDSSRLHEKSHGEAFLALFANRFSVKDRCLYLLDEPETAFSPSRQLAFLSLLQKWEASGNAQVIIVTHSPILMAYPGATILSFDGGAIEPVAFQETEHYRVTKAFLNNPEKVLAELMEPDPED